MTPSKADIKLIRSLDKKRARESTGLFVVEGEKLYGELLKSDLVIYKVFSREEISEEMMSKISHLSTPSPILAVVKKPSVKNDPKPQRGKLYLALDTVKDPGNMGTIIRLAEWFGVDTIFCSLECVDIYNPKVVQSAMGSLFRMNIQYKDLKEVIRQCTPDIPVYGTFLTGENIYYESLPEGAMVVLGSESFGICNELSQMVDKRVHIPSFSIEAKGGESLNVAIAAAVICSEFRRSSVLKPQIG
ncbi:MAG: RNA methyltransferase [Bacteroidetes bacterium HGW-Bacteroidetes-8]|jgi:TrmH family RNA methyltransferase|nr:MAG: RNA methyltransferase [Bacteroidetes bacterium HGW-Bacteroidetes-8]